MLVILCWIFESVFTARRWKT